VNKVSMRDILDAAYETKEPPPLPTIINTALLLIDVQNLASPEHLKESALKAGLPEDGIDSALADYSKRFYAAVANCATLLQHARQHSIACIHVKIEALSGSARDTGPAHRRLGWCYPPGSKETQFLSEVEPKDGEIVITKTVSGAFTATNLDSVLRHMGVQWLIIAGFESDECIEATGRVALDLGYLALFAEDASTAYEEDSHKHTMAKYQSWGLVRSTEKLVDMMSRLTAGSNTP